VGTRREGAPLSPPYGAVSRPIVAEQIDEAVIGNV
jgi:hypothetical protein